VPWELLTDRDKEVLNKLKFDPKSRRGLGKKPAILVIDMQGNMLGSKVPLLKAMDEFLGACGDVGWKAVRNSKKLLAVSREKHVPIIYFIVQFESEMLKDFYVNTAKISPGYRAFCETCVPGHKATLIPEEIAPQEGDLVVTKWADSPFTPPKFLRLITPLGIDTFIVIGGSTSGCVRSTVQGCRDYGFSVAVVEDCVFDRIEGLHKFALLKIHEVL